MIKATVGAMPGTDAWTIAVFPAKDVPVGTEVGPIAALASPQVAPAPEPVLWQYRMRPDWEEPPRWKDWEDCTAVQAADYRRTPFHHDWHYEVRALCLAAPAPVAPQPTPYVDSNPQLHVGESSFEDWYQNYLPNSVGHKQIARDAYAAGMGDPLVAPQPTQLKE